MAEAWGGERAHPRSWIAENERSGAPVNGASRTLLMSVSATDLEELHDNERLPNGRVAACEQPQTFSEEVRKPFRSLR